MAERKGIRMKPIRWGLLSTGKIAHQFADTCRKMGGEVCLYAAASRSAEKANAFADAFDIPVRYGSYEALANDPNVDIVYVATPHCRHYDDMKLLIEAGKPVLCEKSFTMNAGQAREIAALAKEKGVFVMEAFWTKLLPIYREVEAWIAEGRIGETRAVTATYGYHTARMAQKFDPLRAGGTLLDIGVYAVGFACMMLGYAVDDVKSQLVMNDQRTDMTDAILLRCGDAVAQMTCAVGAYIPQRAVVSGTKGWIDIPEFKNPQRITLHENGGETLTLERPFEVNGFEYEIREAMACLRAGRLQSGIMTLEESIAVMEIMDEVRRQNAMRFPMEE